MDLSTLSKETLIHIIEDQQKKISDQQKTIDQLNKSKQTTTKLSVYEIYNEDTQEKEQLDKEKQKAYNKEYYLKNKKILQEKSTAYNKSERRKKSHRIAQWKFRGILCFDYDLLYDLFLSTNKCEYCECELYGRGISKKCLDHDHDITDKFNIRGILCNTCNLKDRLS